MKKLILVGGGGHCVSVLDSAIRMEEYDDIVITDPSIRPGTKIMDCPVVGDDSVLQEYYDRGYRSAFITVGNMGDSILRIKLAEKTRRIGFSAPNIIDPSAVISSHANLGGGVYVGKGAIINAMVKIGDYSIVNTGAIIEHECYIGCHSHVAVGARICGNCNIGEESFIGAGATVTQGVNICKNSFVKAGSLVTE